VPVAGPSADRSAYVFVDRFGLALALGAQLVELEAEAVQLLEVAEQRVKARVVALQLGVGGQLQDHARARIVVGPS